jgi:16S rRNA (cytosine1402-N4)-methyltransferase
VHARSSDLPARLQDLGIPTVDGILLDLGVSSPQFDLAERGFAFSHEGPLDMRMDRSQATTAADLVATLSEEELAEIFHRYGEERFSRRIARTIVQQRETAPIRTTRELAALVAKSVPGAFSHPGRIHPATRVFQALRIAVNDELEELQRTLTAVEPCLAPEGRLSVISFHSLEDRIVKRFFAERSRDCICPPGLPICCCHHQATFTLVTRKPVEADPQEIAGNPRSRSARLRVGIRLATTAAIEEEA